MLGSQFLFQAADWEWALAGWGGGVGTRLGGAPVGRLFFARFPPRFVLGHLGGLSGALGAGGRREGRRCGVGGG